MKMRELIRYNVPAEIVALWEARESETLLPVQEAAVKRHDLFGSGNLLVQAATSSGKTFIGEMAAIHTALRRKKVILMEPLKALTEEKYRDLAEKYAGYGLKVILSTRDHREHDQDLEAGDFSIAVVVYEKLAQLLVRRPERISEIDLVLADELELLSDPDRGAMAELLLTRILRGDCRLIGLSAVIGGADRLAQWMNAQLVVSERRPVELRYGVVHEGVFRYRTYNEYGEGEENLVCGCEPEDILLRNVRQFAEADESTVIFVKAKHESRIGAERIAAHLTLPAAAAALEALRDLEPTRSRDALRETLSAGVAFHNADLSPDERHIVEKAFREREARVLVSTSTLAAGLNLPAHNVFITPEKWCGSDRHEMPWKAPLLRSEYENMSGRAGRYGAGCEFGRSLLIAATPFDRETLWRRYIEGERETIQPRLGRQPLETHVLGLVASRCCAVPEELTEFLESTLTGVWIWRESQPIEETEARIRAAVHRCIDTGVLTLTGEDRLEATPFGKAAAAKGILIGTARALETWIAESEIRDWCDLDLLIAAAMSEDGKFINMILTAREYDHADYIGELKDSAAGWDLEADVPLNHFRNSAVQPFFEEVRAIKTALVMRGWMEGAALHTLEERYDTMAGQITAAAEQISWILDAAAAIATVLGAKKTFTARIQELALRAQYGLDADALPLALLNHEELNRARILALAAAGLTDPAALKTCPDAVLRRYLSRKTAAALKAWADYHGADAAPAIETPPASVPLVIDDRNPAGVLLDGQRVPLQEKQYRLIRVLAEAPGECVPYSRIYGAVWGDAVVESNQMHFQKRKLLRRIEAAVPERAGIITTIAKRGFVLNLAPPEVAVTGAPAPAAV
jgi:helicase